MAERFTTKSQRGGLFQDFMDCGMDLGKVLVCHMRRMKNSELGEMVLLWKTEPEILEKVKDGATKIVATPKQGQLINKRTQKL